MQLLHEQRGFVTLGDLQQLSQNGGSAAATKRRRSGKGADVESTCPSEFKGVHKWLRPIERFTVQSILDNIEVKNALQQTRRCKIEAVTEQFEHQDLIVKHEKAVTAAAEMCCHDAIQKMTFKT